MSSDDRGISDYNRVCLSKLGQVLKVTKYMVLYLYIELPYWWVSIVTGMAAFDSCAISLYRVTVLVGVYCYWYDSIRFLCYISISSYRTGGCLLLLVWQHSILVLYLYFELPYWWVSIVTGMEAFDSCALYLYIECYSVYICSCLYGLVSLCKSYIRLSVCTLSGFVLCIICLLNKCKKWQQTCFCHFI